MRFVSHVIFATDKMFFEKVVYLKLNTVCLGLTNEKSTFCTNPPNDVDCCIL